VNRNPTNGSASDGASNTYNGESDGASQDQNGSSYICRGDGPVHNDAIKTSRLRKFAVNEQSLTNYKGNTENEGTSNSNRRKIFRLTFQIQIESNGYILVNRDARYEKIQPQQAEWRPERSNCKLNSKNNSIQKRRETKSTSVSRKTDSANHVISFHFA
jgi:hypothetical protein